MGSLCITVINKYYIIDNGVLVMSVKINKEEKCYSSEDIVKIEEIVTEVNNTEYSRVVESEQYNHIVKIREYLSWLKSIRDGLTETDLTHRYISYDEIEKSILILEKKLKKMYL